MKKSLMAFCILVSLSAVAQAGNVQVIGVGAKTLDQCPALAAVQSDLQVVHFPDQWRVYVACSDHEWDKAGRMLDFKDRTHAAATSQAAHFTIINGAVYSPAFDWTGTHQRTGREVLAHELGHITCATADEDVANRYADTGACH